ncbi:Protein of unknown function, partial [Gryllus bimaculatus]
MTWYAERQADMVVPWPEQQGEACLPISRCKQAYLPVLYIRCSPNSELKELHEERQIYSPERGSLLLKQSQPELENRVAIPRANTFGKTTPENGRHGLQREGRWILDSRTRGGEKPFKEVKVKVLQRHPRRPRDTHKESFTSKEKRLYDVTCSREQVQYHNIKRNWNHAFKYHTGENILSLNKKIMFLTLNIKLFYDCKAINYGCHDELQYRNSLWSRLRKLNRLEKNNLN